MIKIFFTLFAFFFLGSITAQHNWIRTNPGGGGAIAIVGATANGTIVAASDLSGIYITTNNGESWIPKGATQGLTATHISSLGFHPTDGNTFLIGTSLGLFKTTNAGNTIYPVTMELSPGHESGYVESIGMAFSDANIGYTANYESWEPELSFLKTADGGENWVKVAHDLPATTKIIKILVDKNDANLVYALAGKARFGCSEPYLYRSTNGGINWTRIATTVGPILDFDLHPTDTSTIFVTNFVMADNGCDLEMWQYATDTGVLFKSTDAGVTFTQISDYGGIISVGNDPQHITITDIIMPADWNNNAGTWETNDGGESWSHTGFFQDWTYGWNNINYAFTWSYNGLVKTLSKDQFNPDRLYGCFGGYASSSLDGGKKLLDICSKSFSGDRYQSTGLENVVANALDVNDSDPNIVYVGYYDLGFWYSKDHGATWKKSYPNTDSFPEYTWWAGGGTNNNFILSDPIRPNIVWATFGANNSSIVGALFKSTEYGENWAFASNGLPADAKNMHGLSLDLNSPSDNRTLYLTLDGDVYKSIDDGVNWSMILENGGLKFTEVDHFNSNLIYAGGENGFWRSTDAGQNWAEVGLPEMHFINYLLPDAIMRDDIVPTYDDPWDEPQIIAWQGIFDIKADPNIENRVYATAFGPNKGLYRSNDGGLNWTKLYTNDKMRGIAIAPQSSDVIYVSSSLCYHSGGWDSSSEGILMSDDGADTWTTVNDGMAWTNGGRMEIEHGDHPYIWAVSPGTGLQYADISDYITPVKSISDVNIIGIFPNPTKGTIFFDAETNISNIKMVSMAGLVILNQKIEKGESSITLPTVPSGIYLMEINHDGNWYQIVID